LIILDQPDQQHIRRWFSREGRWNHRPSLPSLSRRILWELWMGSRREPVEMETDWNTEGKQCL